jgi:ferrous iron transport protein A
METRTLAGISEGETVRVCGLHCAEALRSRLLAVGLIPGTAVTCVHRGAGIAAYRIRGAVIALRMCDISEIAVE